MKLGAIAMLVLTIPVALPIIAALEFAFDPSIADTKMDLVRYPRGHCAWDGHDLAARGAERLRGEVRRTGRAHGAGFFGASGRSGLPWH